MAVILVVDDEPLMRDLIVNIVKLSGHCALAARNGLEAVAFFRSYPDLIDLVITDLKMPVMDGAEEIRRIRETRPGATILCMSGNPEQECPAGTMFLSKPFTSEQIRTRVNEALAAHVQ